MKKLMMICMVVLFVSGQSYGAVTVTEEVSDSTYTYTLTNNTDSTIWMWAVWFDGNPEASEVTTDTEGWVCTNLDTQGYFPEEYVEYWGDVEVTDSDGEVLEGPAGEPGMYQTYAGNFTSANPKEHDDTFDAWLGAKFGWDGYEADIKTSCGIGPGETGTLIVEAGSMPGTAKSFSYNTTDYWYSKMCLSNEDLAVDFEEHGTVIPPNVDPTTVTETNNGDGTYTYELTNNGTRTIYNWAVWFTANPGATSITTDDNWVCPFAQHGYFPAEYLVEFPGIEVLDSDSSALVGPAGEEGFYQVYAGDFVSANPKEYDKESDVLIGGESGWDGYEADIRTIVGIGPGETGTMTVEADSVTATSFSYNTTDYWYSMTSMDGPTITTIWCDFEIDGVVE